MSYNPLDIMDEEQQRRQVKAQEFYEFFRSGNNNEIRNNLMKLASNPDLDKQDLALFVMMLKNMPQPYVRRLIRDGEACSEALQRMLITVNETEGRIGGKACPNDVDEIERIIGGPPLSPDIP